MEEQTADLGRSLAHHYGSGVEVEYVDIHSSRMSDYRPILQLLSMGTVPLPLVSINGQPRFAGGISLQAIGRELEKLGLPPVGQRTG